MIGIEKKRFAEAVERILKEELQKGNLPSSKEFGLRLTQYLHSQNLGRPEYRFQKIRNGAVAESAFYNAVIEKIQRDLTILYENTIEIHNELNGKFDWFETEKNKVEYESRKLENELREKIALYGKTGFLTSVFDVFDDVSKIAKQDDVVVDVKKHEVLLKQEQNTSFMFRPAGSLVFQMPKVSEGTFKRIPLTGSPDKILSDFKNEVWQEVWLAKEHGLASGYLEYNFNELHTINRIEIELHTIKPSKVWIEFTSDETNWFHLPYYEDGIITNNVAAFDFPTVQVKNMRIWIEKKEHDNEMVHPEGYQYQYLFGAKSLKFYQLRYPEVGEFETTVLKPVSNGPFSIGKVSLVVEEELPHGTDIEYYVSIPEEESGWKQISPSNRDNPVAPQVIDFKYVNHAPAQTLGIPADLNPEEFEVTELATNGISFYRMGFIQDKDVINKTERLYAGKRAWMVQSTEVSYGGAHIPSLHDWFNPPNEVFKKFENMETGKPGVLMQNRKHTVNTQYYYSVGLFCEEKEKVFTTIPASTEPIAIFLNGEKIFDGVPNSKTQVNYVLKNGWNDIVVLVYIQGINTANGTTIDIGFDPTNLSSYVYGSSKTLEKVSLFDLQHNVKNNDWGKYAFYEKDGKVYIILNYAIPGISYDLFFDYVDKKVRDSIRLKSVFRQNGKGVYTTPKLKRYTIQFS